MRPPAFYSALLGGALAVSPVTAQAAPSVSAQQAHDQQPQASTGSPPPGAPTVNGRRVIVTPDTFKAGIFATAETVSHTRNTGDVKLSSVTKDNFEIVLIDGKPRGLIENPKSALPTYTVITPDMKATHIDPTTGSGVPSIRMDPKTGQYTMAKPDPATLRAQAIAADYVKTNPIATDAPAKSAKEAPPDATKTPPTSQPNGATAGPKPDGTSTSNSAPQSSASDAAGATKNDGSAFNVSGHDFDMKFKNEAGGSFKGDGISADGRTLHVEGTRNANGIFLTNIKETVPGQGALEFNPQDLMQPGKPKVSSDVVAFNQQSPETQRAIAVKMMMDVDKGVEKSLGQSPNARQKPLSGPSM